MSIQNVLHSKIIFLSGHNVATRRVSPNKDISETSTERTVIYKGIYHFGLVNIKHSDALSTSSSTTIAYSIPKSI